MSNGSVKLLAAAAIGGVVMLGATAGWACSAHPQGHTVMAPATDTSTSTASTTTTAKPAGG